MRVVAAALVLLIASCATAPIDKARQFTTGLADGGHAVGKFLASYNEEREGEIEARFDADRDPAKAKRDRDQWRRIYDGSEKALKTYGASVAGLRAGIEVANVAKKLNLPLVISEGLKLWHSLKAALKTFGIDMPMGDML